MIHISFLFTSHSIPRGWGKLCNAPSDIDVITTIRSYLDHYRTRMKLPMQEALSIGMVGTMQGDTLPSERTCFDLYIDMKNPITYWYKSKRYRLDEPKDEIDKYFI